MAFRRMTNMAATTVTTRSRRAGLIRLASGRSKLGIQGLVAGMSVSTSAKFKMSDPLIRRAFFSAKEYPELSMVCSEWRAIRDEGRDIRSDMMWIEDERTNKRTWSFGPLIVEEAAKTPHRSQLCDTLRIKTPRTMKMVRDIPGLLACGFSLVRAHSRIRRHSHVDPCVTASLCLSSADPCWIRVGAETRRFHPGELIVFDFTLPHEIVNESSTDRLNLLILLPNKSLRLS